MKKKFRIFSSVIALIFVLVLAACGSADGGQTTTAPTETPTTTTPTATTTPTTKPTTGKVEYVVEVKAVSGKPVSDIQIGVYLDKKLIADDFTGIDGTATFNLEPNKYTIRAYERDGYIIYEPSLTTTLTGGTYNFTCDTELIGYEADYGHSYELGDVMYDFTVTNSENEELTLSNLMQEYDMIMLNFWYVSCTYCVQEFPAIEQAYNSTYIDEDGNEAKYSDKVAILAINPGIQDTMADVKKFKNSYYEAPLSFDFCMDYVFGNNEPALTTMFNVSGFPTTVVIDKYANISYLESGYCTDPEKWCGLFDEYIAEDYIPVYSGSVSEDGITGWAENPFTPLSSDELAAVASGTNSNGTKFNANFISYDSTGDKCAFPWLISEDGKYLVPSNSGYNYSYSVLLLEVELQAGEVFTFDYFASTETYDILYVIVENSVATSISGQTRGTLGVDDENCFAYVALYDSTYTITITYLKDQSTHTGDDTVYLGNFHIVNENEIDKPTYILREASYGAIDDLFDRYQYYVDYYKGADGYYYVGNPDDDVEDPLLLVDLTTGSHWNQYSLYELALNDKNYLNINGVDYFDIIEKYAIYCAYSTVGYSPVTDEIMEALKIITAAKGSEFAADNENQWLELCVYYSAYAIENLTSPIVGLAPFDPLRFDEDNTVVAEFDRIILPRGLIVSLTVSESGVYGLYTSGSLNTIIWLCDELGNAIDEHDELRAGSQYGFDEFGNLIHNPNAYLYAYLEAGKEYLFRVAFDDMYEFNTLTAHFEYVGEYAEKLVAASPGAFTSSDDEMTDIISGNYVDPILGDDGYYHVKDSNATDTHLYFDAEYVLKVFGTDYKGLFFYENGEIVNSAFNFTTDEFGDSRVNENGQWLIRQLYYYDEQGNTILADMNNLDFSKYEYYDYIEVDEDGNFHYVYTDMYYVDENGDPICLYDFTEAVIAYVEAHKITDKENPLYGLVLVNEEFASILQMLMDKYTFENVEDSWLKVCYYLEYVGPKNLE